MQVETTRFGVIDIPDDEVINFVDGLPGFSGRRSMTLIGAGDLLGAKAVENQHTLFWLQDLHDPDLAFLTTVPWSAYPDYDIDIDPDDVDGAAADELCVRVMVTVRREDGTVRLTANLLAPVVIDTGRRIGRQIILQDGDWPIQALLAEAQTAEAH
jgi:flagellar assembly factor FliW